MINVYVTDLFVYWCLVNYGCALRNWKPVSWGTELPFKCFAKHLQRMEFRVACCNAEALPVTCSTFAFQYIYCSISAYIWVIRTNSKHCVFGCLKIKSDKQKTHQLLVSVPKLLQLRFAAPNPMKSATRPQLWSVGFVRWWHRCERWEWLMFSWFHWMVDRIYIDLLDFWWIPCCLGFFWDHITTS